MSEAKLGGQLRRAVGYGVVVTILLSGAFLVFNMVIDTVISTVETVVVPCQHGGVWNGDECDCSSSGPWVGPMCGECGCVHGQCDQLHISAPFANSLWGCRCPDNWLGAYCDLCTSERDEEKNCNGDCLEGYTGSKCESRCAADADFPTVVQNAAGKYTPEVDLWIAGGTVNACSGHGTCENTSSACLCDDFYFTSADGKSRCERTCRADPDTGALCYGHGVCAETDNIVHCVCQEGYHLKSDCSLACPGMDVEWMKESCSGRGACSLDGDKAVCDCTSEVYLGEACEYKCPTNEDGDSGVPCNGHGVCALTTGPFVQPKCTCAEGWKGPSCECNDAQTCSGHGACTETGACDCDPLFRGKRCNTCVERRYGSQCALQCDERKAADESTPADDIGCNSRGVCVVADFARATESVRCACSRNFDFETRCKECKRFYYPKIGASGLADPEEDAAVACQAFANRATCNQAGEPKLGFSSDASPGAPCLCDQPHVDGNSFCTKCKETFFPDGGDMSGPSSCSKRCVDSDDHPAWMEGVFTLVCKNQGVCDPTGELCVCPDGYSGRDCGIACGGDTPCSGHGQCVSNILEQFLSAEVKNSVAGGASHHCQCDPQPPVDDRERLLMFTGLEDISGSNAEATLEYMGDFCEYSCLHPGWLDSLPCNGETCTALPILDNQGSAVLSGCTQDTDCGDWDSEKGRLVFLDGDGSEIPTSSLSPEQIELRGQISLQNRWSPRMGPFCKVPALPLALHTSNMVCTQRVNEEGRTEATEALCETKATKFDCLSESGNCKWTDACLEGLEKFDEFSYCYELMRTERPGALRSENCTSSCDSDSLSELDWAGVCDHFTARVPAQFQSCSSNLDDLCEESADASADATSKVQSCSGTLSPGAKNMPALDAASLCWELSDEQDAFNSPLAFTPLLDTEIARDLQARFDATLRDLGSKHECAVQTRDVQSSCAQMRGYNSLMLFDTPAPFLYSCEIDGRATLGDTDLAGNDIFCGVKTTVQELSPFVLECASGTVSLKGVTAVEAVEESLRTGCHLLAESDLHASGVFTGERDAASMCRKVLESENPNACERVCGSDSCANVGTSRTGVQIFQCERDDPSTVSEESCLLGTFSLTGGEGGGQYRCAVAGNLLKHTSSFLPCEDSLVLHADRLGFGDAKSSGLDGTRDVVDETVQASSATQTVRVEFDVEIVSASRGAVNVLAQDGVLASVLLRHFGGLGWDLNGQAEDDEPCAAGEGDSCKTKVDVGVPTHVTLEINASHATATFGDDKAVKPIAQGVGNFDGVSVTGSARIKQLFVVGGDNAETCARLHRKTGRAATWRQSLEAASAAPPTTLGYCVNMEKAWATESCDTGSPAEQEVVFGAPWEEYCAYGDHLSHFLSSSDSECATEGISRQSVVDCAPVLSTFSTVACARDAMTFDWENDYCVPLRNDTSPDLLAEIGCDSQCLSELKQSDLSAFCESRADYWVGTEARPRFPSGCAATDASNNVWKSRDWRGWCLAKASNTAEGVCSAATCDCSLNGGFMGGDACELSCSLGSDGSVCNEASFSGVCDYPDTMEAKVDDYYADDTKLVLAKRASEFQGVCKCANSRALAKDGCDVSCDAEDGEPVCNQRNYTAYEKVWQISACHSGGTGVCACLPPMTRQVQENVSDWRGNKATVLSFDYGGLPATAPWADQFRLRAAQGPESLMIRLFNYSESTWRTARHKFEEQPALFLCGDRQCDFSDVVLAQSLYTTSSFFGPTCSRRCPSVDTGESLVKYEGVCDFADPVRADRLTLEACQNECLDEWRCNFVRFNNITSDCRLYESCAPSSVSGEDDAYDVLWYERKLTHPPSTTPCSGRGACTMTGTCVCDSAKFLSLTDPITGKRMRVQADERSSLAEVPTTSLETTGYRSDDCSFVCPGFDPEVSDMSTVCSGHGICTRSAVCQCGPGFTGQNCEYPCPSMDSAEDTTTTCSGHGTCSESRMFPVQSSVEKEDVQKQYALTEAWRNWINACEENQEVSFLVLPFGNYPGMLDQATIKGGVDCEAVPQQIVDDIKDKFTDRPVIEVLAIRDFVELDTERDLDAESMEVEGRSANGNHERAGVFRRRYWNELTSAPTNNQVAVSYGFDDNVKACTGTPVTVEWTGYHNVKEVSGPSCSSSEIQEIEGWLSSGESRTYSNNEISASPGQRRYFKCDQHCSSTGARFEVYCPSDENVDNWQSQNVFVAGYEEVQVEDGSVYEKFPGFRCDGEQIGRRETGVATAGDCALRCEDLAECACFDYQEHYHSAFLGGCRLAKAGLLHGFPIHAALQIGAENGLMEKHQDGDLTAFDEFTETYVVLQSDKSCRATTVNIGDNVASVEDCAQVCANRYDDGCRYFTWSSDVKRCSEVKTSSSLCDEGFNTDPSGFFAVSVENQGSTAPTAYHLSGSARLFPKDKSRGTVSGSYYGRARAEWVIGVAQCSCSKSYGFGHWSGFACQSCEKFWGGESCTKQCPGVLAGEPCFSNGVCLWGSKDGVGAPGTFYDATCLCGDPPAPKSTDLSLTGTWTVTSFDLHVEATFQRLSAQTEYFENPNNYGFSDSTCRGCVDMRGGRNCASQCSWCLFSGTCQFTVSNSISVPCLCTSNYYDVQNGCAPHGFILNNAIIAYDVGGLSETNRARRLEALPGLDVTVGTFYDDAVHPSVQTSLFPSRRFTSPCPNVHETNWMLDLSETPSRACKRLGNCRNQGTRKMIVNGIPPRYFPLSCLELNSGGVAGDTAWESAFRELFFTYEEKFLLDASNPAGSEAYYGGEGTYASFSRYQLDNAGREVFKDYTLEQFIASCRSSCADQPNCVGAVIKRTYGTKNAYCYLSQNTFIASPSQEFISSEPNALFTIYRIKREYDFCKFSDPRNVAVLIKENAACATDTQVVMGSRLPSSDPLYDPDAAQECMNRCDEVTLTHEYLGNGKYCSGGVWDLGHTSVREGKGPMDGSEALYSLLGDPNPVVECVNRCRYAKPTWLGFYMDSIGGCYCAPSCEEDDQVASNSAWKAYRIPTTYNSKYNSFWVNPSGVCYCNQQCTQADLSDLNGANAYQITRPDYRWCSLGSVTYGEIELCADVVLPKQNEDATTDSGLADIDITMGNLGARCEVDLNAYKIFHVKVAENENCRYYAAPPGTVPSSSIYADFLDASDPMASTDRAQECANRCYNAGYFIFWIHNLLQGKCMCGHGTCFFAEYRRKPFDGTDIYYAYGNRPPPEQMTPQWEVRAGSGCVGLHESKIRLHDATSVMLDYANGANALVFGAYKTGEFEASVAKVAHNSFGEMRPENPCNGKAGYFWSITDKTKCEHAETRQTCDIHDWRVCPEAQFSSDTDLHSVHDLRAMYPHRIAVGGSELEATVVELDFTFNLQPIDYSDIDGKISAEQQKIDDAIAERTRLVEIRDDYKTVYDTNKAAYSTALAEYYVLEEQYPSCSYVHTGVAYLTCYLFWIPYNCFPYDIIEWKCAEKHLPKLKREEYEGYRNVGQLALRNMRATDKLINAEDTDKTNAQTLKNKYVQYKIDMIAGETCTTDRKCDLCQGNCDDDSECRDGLECWSSTRAQGSSVKTHYCGGSTMAASTSYCLPSTTDTTKTPYLVGYAAHAGSYTTKIVEVNPSTGSITAQYGESHNDLSFSDAAPDDSAGLYSKRSEPLLARDSTTLKGYIFGTGVTGNVPREGKSLLSINAPRGFQVGDAGECKQLCEQTAGCTAASVVKSTVDNGNFRRSANAYCPGVTADDLYAYPYTKDTSVSASQAVERCRSACVGDDIFRGSFYIGVSGTQMDDCRCFKYTVENCPANMVQLTSSQSQNYQVYDRYLELDTSKPFKCMLHTLSVPQDVQCSSLENNVVHTDVMLLKPERCGLCKAMGMTPNLPEDLEDESTEQIRCSRPNKDEHCEVFPTKDAEGVYSWSEKRCPPVRPGFEKMHTSIVRVGESFKLDEMSPYETISGHPDVQSFGHCESLCVSETKCVAWHFTDILSAERGDDAVTHVCELFSYVPPMISTASERENVFSGRTRIGTVQRDFSQVEIFMDDGDFPSCECNDDVESGGYDCGCMKTSYAPYKPYEVGDETWGCSNKGGCGGTGYFCVCDDGYEWAWGPASNSHGEGYTCRACAAGTYKNSDVKYCTPCPLGAYQDQTGQAQCTACGDQTPTTGATGSRSSNACLTCPSGRISGSLADKTHTDFLNLNYDDSAVLCVLCGVGKFDTGFGDTAASTTRTCQDCPPGKTTSTYGMSACDVTTVVGDCDDPGMAWESPEELDPEVLGGSRCYLCAQGRYRDPDKSLYCLDCPIGYGSTLGSIGCHICPSGYYSGTPADMPAECTACGSGRYSDAGEGQGSSDTCKACVVGKYSDAGTAQTSVSVCKSCVGGRYSEAGAGQISINVCKACVGGRYSDAGAGQISINVCKACVVGKYSSDVGQSSCKFCAPGTYSAAAGSTCQDCATGKIEGLLETCEDCAAGTYQDEEGTAWRQVVPRLTPAGNYIEGRRVVSHNAYIRATIAGCIDVCFERMQEDSTFDGMDYSVDYTVGNNCYCAKTSGGTSHGTLSQLGEGFKQYQLVANYPVITGATRTGCPAQTYTFADFHGKAGDWWVGDGSDNRQLPLTGGFSYEEFDESCTNVRTKPLNGPYGDYNGGAHDWYFDDWGGRHGSGNWGAKQNNIPECQGDCDNDDQCADGLVCFQRVSSDGTNPVPSCDGAALGEADYCVSEFVLRNVDLDTCKQRCDDDKDCSAFRWKADGDNNCQIASDGCEARTGDYVIYSTGTCESRGDVQISSLAECQAAAAALGRTIFRNQVYQSGSRPRCFTYDTTPTNLHYNQAENVLETGDMNYPGGIVCKRDWKSYVLTLEDYTFPCHKYYPSTGAYIGTWSTYQADDLTYSYQCKGCAPGYYNDETAKTSCKQCGAGKYSSGTGSSACTDCGAGRYNANTGSTGSSACTACAAGKYFASTGASACNNCGGGRYSASTGLVAAHQCTACPAGKYVWGSGSRSISACTACAAGRFSGTGSSACTDCAAGKYSESTGASACKACQEGRYSGTGSSDCTACGAGKYSSGTGSTACTACAAGRYATWTGSSGCTGCRAGKYSDESPGGSRESYCKECPAGKYSSNWGSSTCTACAAGRYRASTGGTSSSICEACVPGRLSGTGSSACTVCPAGKYSGWTSSSCTACAAGRYRASTGGTSSSSCTNCAPGRYSASTGATSSSTCTACAAGRYVQHGGATSSSACTLCAAGRFSASTGSSTCTACGAGKYSASTAATSSSTCTACSAGKYSGYTSEYLGNAKYCRGGVWQLGHTSVREGKGPMDGSEALYSLLGDPDPVVECLNRCRYAKPSWHGFYTDSQIGCFCAPSCEEDDQVASTSSWKAYRIVSQGSAACTACPAGTYNANTGASACTNCGAGRFSASTGSSTCTACGAGRYTTSAGSTSISDCKVCGAGTYNPNTGSSACTACAAGRYTTSAESTACTACEAGRYSTSTSSSSCTACPAGTYNPNTGATSSSACTACAAGRYNPYTHRHSSSACTACGAGTYNANTGSSTCTACGAGKYSASTGLTSNSQCTACGAGRYSASTGATSSSACTACGAGRYSASTGLTSNSQCTACGAGKYSASTGATSSSACTGCAAGRYNANTGSTGSSACTACAAGKYFASTGASACNNCGGGRYSASTGLVAAHQCTACGAGKYSTSTGATSSSTCTACAAGRYSASTGLTSNSQCTACGAGKYSTSTGATSSSTCTACGAGRYSGTGSSDCTACGAGRYSASTGLTSNSQCTACGAGKYSASTGATSSSACTACGAGRYNANTGISDCTACAAGMYSGRTGQTSSSTCEYCDYGDTGTYAYGGSAACTACPSGRGTYRPGQSIYDCVRWRRR